MAQVILSDIFIYPVKSLAGIKVSKWTVNNKGLLHDRKWMLIDNHNQFLSQRRLPKMTLIKTEMKNDTLILSTATSGSISLPLNPENGDDINTTIWKDQCLARHPRYISPWDIHVQRFIPLGRLNRVPQYVLRPVSTPHKSRSVKTYLTDLTAYREKIFASLACYRTRRICKFPCCLLRTKNHHFAIAPFP